MVNGLNGTRVAQKKATYSFVDGQEHGTRTTWYEKGQIAEQGEMKFGIQDGEWKMWFEEGELMAQTSYLKGVEQGQRIHWFANGQRKSQATVVDGYQKGLRTFWHENGQIKANGFFDSECWDKSNCSEYKQGAEETFSEDGQWVSTICYNKDQSGKMWLAAKQ